MGRGVKRITDEIPEEGEEDYDKGGESRASPRVKRSILQGQKAFRRVRRAEKAAERLVERVRSGGEGGDDRRRRGPGLNATKAASYAKGVWIRLNGGGKTGLTFRCRGPSQAREDLRGEESFSLGSPVRSSRSPWTSRQGAQGREQGPGGQAEERWGAGEGEDGVAAGLGHLFLLKEAEENVNNLRMELALKTLQLELRLVFEYLEGGAAGEMRRRHRGTEGGGRGGGADAFSFAFLSLCLPERSSTRTATSCPGGGAPEELTLLVAEAALLTGATSSRSTTWQRCQGRAGPSRRAGHRRARLMRLGITDNEVVYMSLDTRIKNLVLIAEDSVQKVRTPSCSWERVPSSWPRTSRRAASSSASSAGRHPAAQGGGDPEEDRQGRPHLRALHRDLDPAHYPEGTCWCSASYSNFPALFPSQFTSARQKSMRSTRT